MSDDLRNRFRNIIKDDDGSSDEIFSIWNQQKKMQIEDKRIAKEIKEAKRKAKELKRTLRKNQWGDGNPTINSLKSTTTATAHTFLNRVQPYASRLYTNKKAFVLFIFIAIGVITSSVYLLNKDDEKETLGDSNARIPVVDDLPREKPRDFKLLLPAGYSEDDYDIVRISPDEADPSYTYLDQFTEGGTIFKVTQQKTPENFDLAGVATEFQATSIIQVDDITVYHGYSEQGGIQSLLFIKKDNLFTIRSSEKFSDDTWASYVASLE